MANSGHHHRTSTPLRRKSPALRRAWCCSFSSSTPLSPDLSAPPNPPKPHRRPPKSPKSPNPSHNHNTSPSPSAKLVLSRRILSPGRVSPIDSDAGVLEPLPEPPAAAPPSNPAPDPVVDRVEERAAGGMDLRVCLKGREGGSLVMEMDSRVLCESSGYFRDLVMGEGGSGGRIEVAGVEDLGVFREMIEMMYADDAGRWLGKVGVSRAIDILEVSSSIVFERGVRSCLQYIDAVPWSESEEEKLRSLFARCTFDEALCQDVLARLGPKTRNNSGKLAMRLIQSVADGKNVNARKEMRSLVNGLLSKSSVYHKDPAGLDKESLYHICHSCLHSLVKLFEEASVSVSADQVAATKETKPLVERVSKQVENLNWLLEILIDKEMAEEFVDLWANQEELAEMHERASPMVRYELSRISASIFIALGGRKLQCNGEIRLAILQAWFGPMLMDFGWLRRCSKGLDMKMLEESMGQVILTLPLKQQQSFFEEWFRCFAGQGTECPNLTTAFQVWWRRSFVRSGAQR